MRTARSAATTACSAYAPLTTLRHDAIADREFGDAASDLPHDAGRLGARRVRSRHRVGAGALIDLDEVDADRFDVDQQLARARRRRRDVVDRENLRPTSFVNSNRAHCLDSSARPRDLSTYFSIPFAIVCSCMLLVPS